MYHEVVEYVEVAYIFFEIFFIYQMTMIHKDHTYYTKTRKMCAMHEHREISVT
jgi:hypothetical protein